MFGNGQRIWGQILILAAALLLPLLECKNQDLTPLRHAMATEISVASSANTPPVKALTSRNSESSSSGAD